MTNQFNAIMDHERFRFAGNVEAHRLSIGMPGAAEAPVPWVMRMFACRSAVPSAYPSSAGTTTRSSCAAERTPTGKWGFRARMARASTRRASLSTGVYTLRHPSPTRGLRRPDLHSCTGVTVRYNGHPDYEKHAVDLSSPTAVIIGNGNVAIDVARILLERRTNSSLQSTRADRPPRTIPSHPIPSHPIPSHPIPSHPLHTRSVALRRSIRPPRSAQKPG